MNLKEFVNENKNWLLKEFAELMDMPYYLHTEDDLVTIDEVYSAEWWDFCEETFKECDKIKQEEVVK